MSNINSTTQTLSNSPNCNTAFRDRQQEIDQDWDTLSRHLSCNGLSFDGDFQPRQFAAGYGNLNYLIRVNGQLAVLRRPPPGPIPPGANDMARENRILSRLPDAFPLAPRALHFCPDPAVLGAPFFIMEYREGITIGGKFPDFVLPTWRNTTSPGRHLGSLLIRLLADLHRVHPARVGLDTLGKPVDFAGRTLRGWVQRAQLAWSDGLPADLRRVLQWLESMLPEDRESCLIHNDFKLDNVILNPRDLAPVAVIDWDMGTQGAPLYDLAVLLSYWTEKDDPESLHALDQMPTVDGDFPTREQAVTLYSNLSGKPLTGLHFYRVLALLRSAVVFRQLHQRQRQTQSTDNDRPDFDRLSAELSSFALSVATGRHY